MLGLRSVFLDLNNWEEFVAQTQQFGVNPQPGSLFGCETVGFELQTLQKEVPAGYFLRIYRWLDLLVRFCSSLLTKMFIKVGQKGCNTTMANAL